jgi:hypothetical protein
VLPASFSEPGCAARTKRPVDRTNIADNGSSNGSPTARKFLQLRGGPWVMGNHLHVVVEIALSENRDRVQFPFDEPH